MEWLFTRFEDLTAVLDDRLTRQQKCLRTKSQYLLRLLTLSIAIQFDAEYVPILYNEHNEDVNFNELSDAPYRN